MTPWRLVLRSLAYHWRIQAAVALGVAAATAVLTGALVVGDSVRASLSHLALDRLGDIDDALIADRFFRRELADEVARGPLFAPTGGRAAFRQAVPAILLQGSAKNLAAGRGGRAGHVTAFGCDDFAALGSGGPRGPLPPGEAVLNQPLADALDARPGDEIFLRIGQIDQIPADSPLGRKTETVRNRRLTVRQIVPAEGLGRFGLRPTQQLPLNLFVATETLAQALGIRDKANSLFVVGPSDSADDEALQAALHPQLADYGFALARMPRGYYQFSSDRLIIEPAAERAVLRDLAEDRPQPVLTYLANTLRIGSAEIPYSTVAAIDFAASPPLGDDEIVLNSWAADDLDAKPGDRVELTYFEPESTHGEVREQTVSLRLAAIVPLEGAAADRHLTPEMPGITDQTSIGDWNPPFPFDSKRVRKKDEKYWDDYRATPKAFVSLATGRRLWASRFGQSTSIRLAAEGTTAAEDLIGKLHLAPADFGLRFLPVRRQVLLAAAGTTPFSVLFLSFSFFIIAAALMLVAILFQLGLTGRASELGLLLAVGVSARRLVGLLLAEGLMVAALGALVGSAAGVGYAWLMLAGLRTWWLGAISTPFLRLYVAPPSLAIGYFSGVLVALLTIWWAARRLRKQSVRALLSGQASSTALPARGAFRRTTRLAYLACAGAAALGLAASRMGGEAQAGAFFTSGMLVLGGLLALLFVRLRIAAAPGVARSLGQLALRSGRRNPTRSTLSVGLVAAASFLIVATGAFRLDPEAEARGRAGGSGGFALVAESDLSIYQDLDSPAGREELGFGAQAEALLARGRTFALRVRGGDDASCLNLYQPSQPRVLGVPQTLIDRGGFAWAGSAANSAEERANPWFLLDRELPADASGVSPVPVVLDQNTARYSLHLWKGIGETYDLPDGRGGSVRLQVVGLLANSLFQGDVLMSERHLLQHFPEVSGYRFFLVELPVGDAGAARRALEDTLEDYGFIAQPAVERLAGFMAVQNTYLSTFQSLGGLGLLLGTVGLAVVQLRSVVERRGELALMQAVGFRRRRLAAMVMLENGLLLLSGLAVGVAAALVAVFPHLIGGAAGIGWSQIGGTLALVLAVGLLAGLIAVRAVLRAELLPALKAE